MTEILTEDQKTATALAKKTEDMVLRMRDEAFRVGWARGYEKGFTAGVEAAIGSTPKVQLTDA